MTKIYFVRHAQPVHTHADDWTRPLTAEGAEDAGRVLEVLRDKGISACFCSPYLRSIDTIRETADYFGLRIQEDVRLRERQKGANGNNYGMFQKRWANHGYHEDGGESIGMVQRRNIEALKEILEAHDGEAVLVGTHGTALSTIVNYYRPEFGCEDFLRIIDWMPYIVEMDFEGQAFVGLSELFYLEKEFKGPSRADK